MVFTRENRGGPLNTQHAPHRPVQATARLLTDESLALCHPYLQLCCSVHPHHPACSQEEEVVVNFTRENRGGSAQHATRTTSALYTTD